MSISRITNDCPTLVFKSNNIKKTHKAPVTQFQSRLSSNQINILGRFQNLAIASFIIDLCLNNPISLWVTIHILNQQDISPEEKRAIVIKRVIDIIGSSAYWFFTLATKSLVHHAIRNNAQYWVGNHIKGPAALDGISNLSGIIVGMLINEIAKPAASNWITAYLLKKYHDNGIPPNSFFARFLKIFGYNEDDFKNRTDSIGNIF